MLTMSVHEVAEHYGVSDAFMVRALDKIGFRRAKSATPLPTATVTRSEATFGSKIRAAQPKPTPDFTAESDTAPTASRAICKPTTPHVMRISHAESPAPACRTGCETRSCWTTPDPST